jgi:hypothetical protein
MRLEATGTAVRFIESTFDESKTRSEITQVFGEASSVAFTQMSLRSIFLAVARDARKHWGTSA